MVDLRRIRIGIQVEGRINWYENPDMHVRATGTKFANPLQGDCTVTIGGLSASTRDFILTETSPLNRIQTPKRLIVQAGRQSTGVFEVFQGDVTSAEPGTAPDHTLTIRAKTGNFQASKVISVSGGAIQKLSAIADRAARELDVALDFIATDKNISNFSFSGAALKLVDMIQQAGNVRAFIDNSILVVKDANRAHVGRIKVLNMESGMVGVPRPTETGVDVTYMVDGESLLGGMLRIDSRVFRAVNGDYIINQLKFDLASHEDPFYWVASCQRAGQ